MSSSVEAAVTSEAFEFGWLLAGCHWEMASKMTAGVSEDVNDALTGHAGAGSVGRTYGAKGMLKRFGLPILNDAASKGPLSWPRLVASSLLKSL
jgi:hypothetical protein